MRAARVIVLLVAALAAAPAASQGKGVPGDAAEIELSFAPVARKAAPAVVNIYATRIVANGFSPFAEDPFFSQFFGPRHSRPRVENALGSGVILDADGYVVSNHHVVSNAQDIRVVLSDRREYPGEVVLSDEAADISVIRLDGARDLPALELGDSDALEVGDLVLAIGNPFGIGQTVSSGIVSGLARSGLNVGDGTGYFIQTDAPINPGNSGGALVDMQGRLVGINTAILTRSGGSNGIGFAIPSNLVRAYLDQARAGNSQFVRPWAGVAVQPVDMAMAEAIGLDRPQGVALTEVHPQSPFARAGLRPGDVVISIAELPVNAEAELDFRIATLGRKGKTDVRVFRDGGLDEVGLTLGPAPDEPPADPRRIAGRTPLDGLTVARVNPRLIQELSLPLSAEGVIALAVEGFAARLGLKAGDRIEAINGRQVESPADVERASRRLRRSLDLQIRRDGRPMRLRVNL